MFVSNSDNLCNSKHLPSVTNWKYLSGLFHTNIVVSLILCGQKNMDRIAVEISYDMSSLVFSESIFLFELL